MAFYGYDTKSEPIRRDGKVLVQFFHFGRRIDFFVYVTPEEWQWLNEHEDLSRPYHLFREFDEGFNVADRDERATSQDREDAKRLLEIMHRKHEPLPFHVAWVSL